MPLLAERFQGQAGGIQTHCAEVASLRIDYCILSVSSVVLNTTGPGAAFCLCLVDKQRQAVAYA